ncbi:MAG: hypothetical protein V4515_03590 [Chloroflexota bacterium]
MSMWRCPHCATPQAETARCWVCHRSSTTCSTCRHFRRSVAAQVGFCGLDRRRLPLAGTEHRGCWEAGVAPTPEAPVAAAMPHARRLDPENVRDFVPVELGRDRQAGAANGTPIVVGAASGLAAAGAGGLASAGAGGLASAAGGIAGAGGLAAASGLASAAGGLADPVPDLVVADRWTNRVTLFGELDR